MEDNIFENGNKCSCGGEVFLFDSTMMEGEKMYFWSECLECGKVGKKFNTFEEAVEDFDNWK